MRKLVFLFVLMISPPAFSEVIIENPWVRATAPGAKLAAGYMVIRNQAAASDRLLGAASPAAARVEMHVTVRDGDIMRMREVKELRVPAQGSLELKPGGAHLMFVDIRHPYREGEKVPVTLRFARAGEVRAAFRVGRIAATGGHPKH
jgi:hypothetical protein